MDIVIRQFFVFFLSVLPLLIINLDLLYTNKINFVTKKQIRVLKKIGHKIEVVSKVDFL